MTIESCAVTSVRLVAPNMYVLSFRSPRIASGVAAGQFVNIKVNDLYQPLLRRPFSVYRVAGDDVEIIFNVIGLGTRELAGKSPGAAIDVLGPLGRPFRVDGCGHALLVAGGLGVAPLPLLYQAADRAGIPASVFLGARTRDQIVPAHLGRVVTAADDGTAEVHGTVVEALRLHLKRHTFAAPKIFGCGPNAMLRALGALAADHGIACEVSLESAMACGIGICQGCPVELSGGEKRYALICREGTVFDTRTICLR
jgi:dihydroorotate dehydrogenase electron transfer subunit